MECSHPGLKSFTFSDGNLIQCCNYCEVFDESRRAILCPDSSTPSLVDESGWLNTLPKTEREALQKLAEDDCGHDPQLVKYGFSEAELADIEGQGTVSAPAHHKAVSLNRNRDDKKAQARAAQRAKLDVMRRAVWGLPADTSSSCRCQACEKPTKPNIPAPPRRDHDDSPLRPTHGHEVRMELKHAGNSSLARQLKLSPRIEGWGPDVYRDVYEPKPTDHKTPMRRVK